MFTNLNNTQKGMLLALIGYTSFAFADVAAKWLTNDYAVFQVTGIITGVSSAFFLVFSSKLGGFKSILSTKQPKIHYIRAVLNFIVAILAVYSFSLLPLASVYTILFSMPFFATLLAIPFYGEVVQKHRWIAIILGFIGVLAAFRPWAQDFNVLLLVPLFTAVCIACLFLISRSLKEATLLELGFFPAFGCFVLVTPLMAWFFKMPELADLPIFLIAGIGATLGIMCVSKAFYIAQASVVSPFVYTQIIWGILFGYFVFGDVPDYWMLIGASIIIVSGLYLVHSERRS